MGILSDEDFKQSMQLPNGCLLRNVAENISEAVTDTTFANSKFGTSSWSNALQRIYRRVMAKVPLFPCVNCGSAQARNTSKKLFVKKRDGSYCLIPLKIENYTEDMWSLQSYKAWYR